MGCDELLTTVSGPQQVPFNDSSTLALDLIGFPNMQYDDVRLDSVKTVFRVVSPEYHVPKSNFKGLVHIMVGTMIISAPIIS